MSGDDRSMPAGRRIAAAELLAIDVDAELGAVCEAQLHGSWQLPAELVRYGIRSGAAAVEVTTRRGTAAVGWSGLGLAVPLLRLLCTALDRALPAATRHRAIIELESAGAQALLWVVGAPGARVVVVSACQGVGAFRFEYRGNARPRLDPFEARCDPDCTEISLAGVQLGGPRAADWVRSSCRFAPVPVMVDGQQVREHVAGALYRSRVDQPLTAQLWIATSGSAPCLWILQHGVLSTRATVPGYPAFHAVLEMGHLVPEPSTSAALREAVTPYLEELIDQATSALVRIGRGMPGLDDARRDRVTELLLRSARRGLRREEIRKLPLIPTLQPGGRHSGWLTIAELEERLESGRHGVYAVDPERARSVPEVGAATVAVVTTEQRGLLEDVMGHDLEQPPPSRRQSRGQRVHEVLSSVTEWLPWIVRALWAADRHGPAVDPGRLTVGERRLVEALAAHGSKGDGSGLEVSICDGGGPLRRPVRRAGRVRLPRRDPLVQACSRLLERDLSWTYPVVLALLDETGLHLSELRSGWLRSMLRGHRG